MGKIAFNRFTAYDSIFSLILRHFTMVGQAPKIARWDYHSCHVNQLYTLASATSDPEVKDVLLTVAERWRGYMIGKIADHN